MMSDYELAVEKLAKLKLDGFRIDWTLHQRGTNAVVKQLPWVANLDWWNPSVPGIYRRTVYGTGNNPLDAACGAIDHFRNALLKEEEAQKQPVWAAVDLGSKSDATVFGVLEPDGKIHVYDEQTFRREYLNEPDPEIEEWKMTPFPPTLPRCAGCRGPIQNLLDAKRLFRLDGEFDDVCAACWDSPGPRVNALIEECRSIQCGIMKAGDTAANLPPAGLVGKIEIPKVADACYVCGEPLARDRESVIDFRGNRHVNCRFRGERRF